METEFKIGRRYTLNEILENGFVNVKVTAIVVSYKKEGQYLSFSIPSNNRPRKYKLLATAIIT